MTAVVTPSRANAAIRLRVLAGKPGLRGQADQLRALAAALDAETDAGEITPDIERWAGVDIHAAFLHEEVIGSPGRHGRWASSLLEIVIRVLFFAPIVITWLGLMLATVAYQHAVKMKSFSGTTFLQGWQSGFAGHLSAMFYLNRLALYVVTVITALVVLLIVQYFDERNSERERMLLYQDLAAALTDADLQLALLRVSAPAEAAAALHRATTGFNKTADTIREVGETASLAQREAVESLAAVVTAMGRAEALSAAMHNAADGIGKSSSQLEERLTEISTTTSAIAAAELGLVREIGTSSERLSGSMDTMVRRFQEAVTANHAEVSAAFDSSSNKITNALTTAAGQVRESLAELTSAAAGYARRAESAADLLEKTDATIGQIPGIVSELKVRVADLGDRVAELQRAIVDAAAAVPKAGASPLGPSRDLLADLSRAANELRMASEVLRTSAGEKRRRWLRKR